MRLDQVYISLDTVSRVEGPMPGGLRISFEAQRRSAFDVATEARRLVLLGGPGSGKSSFVHHLSAWLADAALGECAGPPGGTRAYCRCS